MRSLRARWWSVAALTFVVSCSSGSPVETTLPDDLSPTEVVASLVEAIAEGRFEDTSQVTDTEQAALVALAEGADATEIVGALSDNPDAVAANFWTGFAQTLDSDFSPDSISLQAGDPVEEGGNRYVPVTVAEASGTERTFYLRQDDGWTIDLMATFGHVLAERLIPRVEALLSSANTNAARLIGLLRESAPSLQLAAQNPNLDLPAHQSLLALLERVTRAG